MGHLHHELAGLHRNLLHGKLPRDLRWADTLELIEHLGHVKPQGGEEFVFTVGAQRELFKRPRGSKLALDEISRLRRFLKAAGTRPEETNQVNPAKMIVVIDHHSARLFQDLNASRPQAEVDIKPYDPNHFHHHLIHRKEARYEGDRVPEETSFYTMIGDALVLATDIVLIGHGVGKSSAVVVLLDYLKEHRPAIARCVRAVEVADLSALTEAQIETLAKRSLGPHSLRSGVEQSEDNQ